MREHPARDLRAGRIGRYRAEAARLLSLIQRNQMKTQIGRALHDLQEAAAALEHPAFDRCFVLQQLADCAIENAIRRLAIINAAVERYGPSVSPIQSPNSSGVGDSPLQACVIAGQQS